MKPEDPGGKSIMSKMTVWAEGISGDCRWENRSPPRKHPRPQHLHHSTSILEKQLVRPEFSPSTLCPSDIGGAPLSGTGSYGRGHNNYLLCYGDKWTWATGKDNSRGLFSAGSATRFSDVIDAGSNSVSEIATAGGGGSNFGVWGALGTRASADRIGDAL